MRSMRSMRGGFIFRSRGPLQKVCHGSARLFSEVKAQALVKGMPWFLASPRGYGRFVQTIFRQYRQKYSLSVTVEQKTPKCPDTMAFSRPP